MQSSTKTKSKRLERLKIIQEYWKNLQRNPEQLPSQIDKFLTTEKLKRGLRSILSKLSQLHVATTPKTKTKAQIVQRAKKEANQIKIWYQELDFDVRDEEGMSPSEDEIKFLQDVVEHIKKESTKIKFLDQAVPLDETSLRQKMGTYSDDQTVKKDILLTLFRKLDINIDEDKVPQGIRCIKQREFDVYFRLFIQDILRELEKESDLKEREKKLNSYLNRMMLLFTIFMDEKGLCEDKDWRDQARILDRMFPSTIPFKRTVLGRKLKKKLDRASLSFFQEKAEKVQTEINQQKKKFDENSKLKDYVYRAMQQRLFKQKGWIFQPDSRSRSIAETAIQVSNSQKVKTSQQNYFRNHTLWSFLLDFIYTKDDLSKKQKAGRALQAFRSKAKWYRYLTVLFWPWLLEEQRNAIKRSVPKTVDLDRD